MAWLVARRARARTNRPPTRRRQLGFLRLSMFMARWGSSGAFRPQDLFRAGEAGAHFEAYNPNDLLRRRNLVDRSEEFDSAAYWSKNTSNATAAPVVTANYAAAPDGNLTADRVQITLPGDAEWSLIRKLSFARPINALTLNWGLYLAATDATQVGKKVNFYVYDSTNAVYVAMGSAVLTLGWQRVNRDFAFPTTNVLLEISFGKARSSVSGGLLNAEASTDFLAWGGQLTAGPGVQDYQKVTDWNTEYLAAAIESVGMWQDAAGTTPVTAVEQPVGMWLDRKLGLARGPNIAADGGFDAGLGAWTDASTAPASVSWAAGVVTITRTDANNARLDRQLATVANTWYIVQADIGAGAALSINVGTAQGGSTLNASVLTAGGTRYAMFLATGAATWVRFISQVIGATTLDNVSVRALPGNPASQATGGARPTLSARINLQVPSNTVSNGANGWGATGAALTPNFAPINGVPGTRCVRAGSANGSTIAGVGVSSALTGSTLGRKFALQLRVRSNGGTRQTFQVRLQESGGATGTQNGSQTFTADGTDQLCTLVYTLQQNDRTAVQAFYAVADGAGDYDLVTGQYQFEEIERTATAPSRYQDVRSLTDYDTDGWPHFLRPDGSDDGLATATIDASAFNCVMVVVGATKAIDTTTGVPVEFSLTSSATAGSFGIIAPSVGVGDIQFRAGGTTPSVPATVNTGTWPAPVSSVITGLGEIATPVAAIRLNNVEKTRNAASQGAGNFTAQTLNIARRGNNTLPFNGRIYSVTVRFSNTPTSEKLITQMNRYAANLMAISI